MSRTIGLFFIVQVFFASCSRVEPQAVRSPAIPVSAGQAVGLDNLLQASDSIFSGSEPVGSKAFSALQELGVKTILSVDSAAPDPDAAATHGLRYVHFPVGYSGLSHDERLRLLRLVRDLERPLYVHCHLGQHRGPAIVAYALISLDVWTNRQGLAFLEKAQTSRDYGALFDLVEKARPVESSLINSAPLEVTSRAHVSSLAESMARLDRTWRRLERLHDGWKPRSGQPQSSIAAESVILAEHFREMARLPDVANREVAFLRLLQQAESSAWSLAREENPARDFAEIEKACTACHRAFR